MNQKILRYTIDTLMMLVMIVLMGYQVTGNQWHEIIGIGLFVLFLIHCILNRKWFANLPLLFRNSTKRPAAFFWFLTNILLLLAMIALAVSSIFISKNIFAEL